MIFTLASIGLQAQDKAVDILNKMSKNLSFHKSVSYNVVTKMYIGDKDSFASSYSAHIKLMRAGSDSDFYGGYVWVSTGDTGYQFYDLNNCYSVNTIKKTVTKSYPHRHFDRDLLITSGVWHDFMDPPATRDLISFGINKSRYNIKLSFAEDTIIDGEKCWHIIRKYEDVPLMIKQTSQSYIRKKDYTEVLFQEKRQLFGRYTSSWTEYRTNCEFDNENKEVFNTTQIPTGFTIKDYVVPKPPEDQAVNSAAFKSSKFEALDSGSMAPALRGKLYQENFNNFPVNFKGKITVLDFWFMTCMPCQKSMPYMDSLKEKYEKKGVQFYAVNDMDNNSKALPKFPGFIKKHHFKCDILLVNGDISKKYHATAYPTFFVINREGKVCYCFTGFYPYGFKEMAATIEKLLKETSKN